MADDSVNKPEAEASKTRDSMPVKSHGAKSKLKKHELYQKAIDKAFKAADYDSSGTISGSELYAAILLVYDKINKLSPVHINPPKSAEIKAVIKKHDVSSNGNLSKAEFSDCVLDVLAGSTDSWHKSIWFRVASAIVLKLAFYPAAAWGLKSGLDSVGFKPINKVPTAVIAVACEQSLKVANMLLGQADD